MNEDQVPQFLQDLAYDNSTEDIFNLRSDETVYTIWIGTNDLGCRAFTADFEPHGLPVTNYTNCVYYQLDRLYEVGARYFVILNNAPLQYTAQYGLPGKGGEPISRYWLDKQAYDANLTHISEKMRHLVQLVNTVFDYQTPYLAKMEHRWPGATVVIYDVYSLVNRTSSSFWAHWLTFKDV